MSTSNPLCKPLLIINPISGGKRGQSTIERLEQSAFRDRVDSAITQHRGHASEIASTCADNQVVVAVGGDGTVNEVEYRLLAAGGEHRGKAFVIALNLSSNAGYFHLDGEPATLPTEDLQVSVLPGALNLVY